MNGCHTTRTIARLHRYVRQLIAVIPLVFACAIAFTVASVFAPAASAQGTPPPQYLFGYGTGTAGPSIFTYIVQ